jgi:hypothetical protein
MEETEKKSFFQAIKALFLKIWKLVYPIYVAIDIIVPTIDAISNYYYLFNQPYANESLFIANAVFLFCFQFLILLVWICILCSIPNTEISWKVKLLMVFPLPLLMIIKSLFVMTNYLVKRLEFNTLLIFIGFLFTDAPSAFIQAINNTALDKWGKFEIFSLAISCLSLFITIIGIPFDYL